MASIEHERFGDRGVITAGGAEPWLGGPAASLDPGPQTSAPSAQARRSAWAYGKAALIHPANLIVLAGVLMLGLIHPSLEIALLGLGVQGFFFYLAPKSPWFRRCLDEGFEEAARSAAQRARELLIAKMADGHRDELARIDSLIRRIQESEGARADPVSFAEDLELLRGFTASYIRLALAHKACEDALAACEHRPARVSLRSLEAAQNLASPRVREAIRERLAIAYQRVEYEAHLREDTEVLAHQLATLVELVHLRHQRAITLGPSAEAYRSMQALEEIRTAARELSELDAKERLPMKSIACA
jgi:hypothetical protein